MSTPKKFSLTKKQLATVAACLIAVLAVSSTVYALTHISAPEYAADTPLDPTPTPTVTPSPTATPTTQPVELHLLSNLTIGQFYKGDTLHIIALTTPPQQGIPISLYNLGNFITTNQTDSTGKAFFDRNPVNPFNYTITMTIP